ncbi:MAG: DHH family phosphoesterase [Ruminococcus sp.]|nr:DHH family phosphoesterase [Ruminococcus sp.]
MRKKVWITGPWFLVIAVSVFAMAAFTFRYNLILSCAEIAVGVASIFVIIISRIRLKKYIDKTVTSTISNISDINQNYLERFKMPMVVVGKFGDILWSNSRFKKQLCMGRNPVNENVSIFLGSKTVEEAADSDSFETDFDGSHYAVFCTPSDEGYVFFFIDNTHYNTVAKKFIETKKSVALIVFDNREQFSNDSEEDTVAVVTEVENKLLRFAIDNSALYKRLPSNKYMIIFDKIHLDKIIADKFPILKDIRTIKYNDREATISVGIGADCDSIVESEQKARKALDMSLGRGGDQVAVMRGDNYEFFGGVSAGIERMSKVKTRVVATSISRVISESDRVLIMGHRFSDLDCVGAAVGMQSVVEKGFKKNCRIVVDKETTMAKSLIDYVENEKKDIFITVDEGLKYLTQKTLLIIVDTHIPNVVESPEILEKSKRTVVIDHHRKMVNYIDDAIVFFHEPTSSSACEMVAELVTYMGENFCSKLQAEAMLSGIMLDTKNFVLRTGVRTFEAAAFLRKKGADTVETKRLFASSLDIHKEKYKIVDSAEIKSGCAVAITDSEDDNIRLICAQAADELLSIEGVDAGFVIFKAKDKTVNISARSYGKLNVQVIMEALGGGGHQNMAATQLGKITLREAKDTLLQAIENIVK